jgi:hypothetical protein
MDTWRPLDPEDRRPGSSEGRSVPSSYKKLRTTAIASVTNATPLSFVDYSFSKNHLGKQQLIWSYNMDCQLVDTTNHSSSRWRKLYEQ